MASITSAPPPLSVRDALACAAATLITYVGVVHEVVGTILYPEGPSEMGGPIAWHAVGLAGIAAGLLLGAGTLRVFPVPVRPLAAAVGLIGAFIFASEAFVHGGFHFFALTIVLAGGFLAVTKPTARAPA